MLVKRYKPPTTKKAILVPILDEDKPLTRSPRYRSLIEGEASNAHIIGYALYIGPVPWELAETYPLSQYETPGIPYTEAIEETASRIVEYVKAKGYEQIEVKYCGSAEWSTALARSIAEKLNVQPKPLEDC